MWSSLQTGGKAALHWEPGFAAFDRMVLWVCSVVVLGQPFSLVLWGGCLHSPRKGNEAQASLFGPHQSSYDLFSPGQTQIPPPSGQSSLQTLLIASTGHKFKDTAEILGPIKYCYLCTILCSVCFICGTFDKIMMMYVISQSNAHIVHVWARQPTQKP